MKAIINRQREFRVRKGLAQWDVALRLGFRSTDRISRWENGIMYPSVVNFMKLLELYEATPKELYPDITEETTMAIS